MRRERIVEILLLSSIRDSNGFWSHNRGTQKAIIAMAAATPAVRERAVAPSAMVYLPVALADAVGVVEVEVAKTL